MNILPKKSWHVRNKDNIDRVRRDEENARLEEEKLAKRAALAEQEARTKLLREKVKSNSQPSSIASPASSILPILPYDDSEHRHINLFHEEERGSGGATTNAEYEAEKKIEQEKKEKALGVLKYLAQDANEDPQPWYLQKDTTEKSQSQDDDRKSKLDPLVKMNTFLDQTKRSESQKKEKRKKEKKRHQEKYKARKTIDDLRAERLQREKNERFRAEKLIMEQKDGKSSKSEDDPYKNQYYSQYNPVLAKKLKCNRRNQPF